MRFASVLLWLVLGAALAGAAHAQSGVAKVNGVVIPQGHMDLILKDLVAQGRPDSPELRDAIREDLISRELLAQEALRRGLEKNPEVATRLALMRLNTLAQSYLQSVARNVPTGDEAVRKEYDRIKAEIGTREYKARHILVEKEEEAKEIIAQLKKGANFEKLAAERSKDEGTKAAGGDLGWNTPNRFVKAFADALARLKKGQTTDTPVQSEFGWHVVRLDDERALKLPSFEEVKPNLQQQMVRQAQEKALSDLRAKAKIE